MAVRTRNGRPGVDRPLRIGVSCYPTYGGSGVVASEVAKAMADRGHEVHVLSWAVPFRLAAGHADVTFHQVEVRTYPLFEHPPYSLALATAMVDVARRYELDLMHVHYAVPNAVSAVLARQILAPERQLPVITTLHGTDVTLVGNDPSYLATTRFSVNESEVVTAVSDSLRRTTAQQLGVDRPILVVPNFVDINPEELEAARSQGKTAERYRQGDEKLIVHVSNYRSVKRIPDVVSVFKRVRDQLPARLLLVGDGPDQGKALAWCREQGLEDAVSVLGQLPRVEEALLGADLFLLPSESESFGLAALEALACGVPVIASEIGGLPEVVRHGETGYLCSVGDTEAMAAHAVALLGDADRHRAMSAEAAHWAGHNFDRESVVDAYLDAYLEALAVHGS